MKIITVICSLVFGALITMPPNIKSDEASVSTNMSWLSFSMSISKTNVNIGEPIKATVIVSNSSDEPKEIHWQPNTLYLYDFGYFIIKDVNTEQVIPYKRSEAPMPGLDPYEKVPPHQAKVCSANLENGYSLTNAGTYNIQAVEWFPPKQHMFPMVTSAPIVIHILEGNIR